MIGSKSPSSSSLYHYTRLIFRHLHLISQLSETEEGREKSQRFKAPKRFLALILGPLLSHRPDPLVLGLIDKAIETFSADKPILIELYSVKAEIFKSQSAYIQVVQLTEDVKRLAPLAITCNRLSDVLFLVSQHGDEVLPPRAECTDPFIWAVRLFAEGNSQWKQVISRRRDGKALGLIALAKLALFPVPLGWVQFYLQLAIEVGKESKQISSTILSCVKPSQGELVKVPINTWSALCLILNGLSKIQAGEHTHRKCNDFRQFVMMELLNDNLASFTEGALYELRQSRSALASYLEWDGKQFRLGPALLGTTPLTEEAPTDNPPNVIPRSPSLEFEELQVRKQLLATRVTARQTSTSFDLNAVIFVVDTNVLVACPDFLEAFLELPAHVLVPVVVLEELVNLSDSPVKDKAKKALAALQWLERHYAPSRDQHRIRIDALYASGSRVSSFRDKHEPDTLGTATNDDLIVKLCQILQKRQHSGGAKRAPILISQDVNMSLKARAHGIATVTQQDFDSASFY